MAIPKLTREDCESIRRQHNDRTRKIKGPNLAHLFHVKLATIYKVLNGTYIPLEDYEANLAAKRLPRSARAGLTHEEITVLIQSALVNLDHGKLTGQSGANNQVCKLLESAIAKLRHLSQG